MNNDMKALTEAYERISNAPIIESKSIRYLYIFH